MENSDFKYILQDTGNIYIGARFSFEELLNNKELNFKVKAIIEHYLLKEVLPDTSLESELYYMKEESYFCRTLMQLKANVKYNVLVEKKVFLNKPKRSYVEKTSKIADFAKISEAEKKKGGVLIQEMSISKLALMSFSV